MHRRQTCGGGGTFSVCAKERDRPGVSEEERYFILQPSSLWRNYYDDMMGREEEKRKKEEEDTNPDPNHDSGF